jgi:exocyst complex component 1
MKELQSLLDTCAITANDLEALRFSDLNDFSGIEEIETALVTLFKAMLKIDPSMGNTETRQSEDASSEPSGLSSDFSRMRIVQEKKEMYTTESAVFMRKLVAFMGSQFDSAFDTTRREMKSLSKKADPGNHDKGREGLWQYSPLMIYARDVDLDNWNRIIQVYQDKGYPLYKSEFRDTIDAWKKNARKPTGEELELLFTAQQEKKDEGIATTARKLTVKRSQTLARSLRSPLGDGSKTSLDKSGDSRSHPYEVFASVLDELLPLVQQEQNFVIDFFHATTMEQLDFADAVAASRPRDRRGGDLKRHRLMEPDRELARRVTRAMEVIFSFLEQDLQSLVDWVLSMDPL